MLNKLTFDRLFWEYSFLFICSFSFVFLMTFNFQFFLQDFINISLMGGDWNYSQLGGGYEFYFRPLENFVFFIFLNFFGIDALPFRIFKATIAAGVFCLVYFYIKKYSGSKKIALLGAVFNITAPGTLASIFLIYDFEIVMQFILLLATLFLINGFENNKFTFKKIICFLLLIYLAVLTKESSKVFIGATVLTLLLWHYKKLKIIILSSILLFLALKPGFFLGFNSQTANMFGTFFSDWATLDNFKIFSKNFLFLSFGVVSALSLLLVREFKKMKNNGFSFRLTKINFLWLIWFLLASISAVFVPMSEARYLAVQFLPFTLFAFIIIGKRFSDNLSEPKIGKYAKITLVSLILLSVLFNVVLSMQYRYGQMNFYKILGESNEFFENNYNNSTLSFFGGDTFFYPMAGSNNNNSYVSRQEILKNDSNKLFFLEGSAKNRRGVLEKTFVRGPYCLMLYSIERNDSNYCSIEIETYFWYPQNIKIEFIGEEKNITFNIKPPLGKQVSCEYLCPELDRHFKIKSVNITASQNRFNKLINSKIHLNNSP